jgi:hypothetical protein
VQEQGAKVVETVRNMKLEYVVSGVMPFFEEKLVVLANNGDLQEYKNVNVLPQESDLKENKTPKV